MKSFVLLALVILPALSRAELNFNPVYYPVTDENWAPYWITSENKVTGILHEIMLELDKRLPYNLVPTSLLSPKRSQLSFIEGIVQLECCVSRTWREKYVDNEASLWSDTVLVSEDILIFPKGMSFSYQQPSDLKDKRIVTILGYSYVGQQYFTRSDSPNHISLLHKLALMRADAGIIDHYELNYLIQNDFEARKTMRNIDKGPIINNPELKIRVHISRPEILEPINRTLSGMRNEGVIQEIINQYTAHHH